MVSMHTLKTNVTFYTFAVNLLKRRACDTFFLAQLQVYTQSNSCNVSLFHFACVLFAPIVSMRE